MTRGQPADAPATDATEDGSALLLGWTGLAVVVVVLVLVVDLTAYLVAAGRAQTAADAAALAAVAVADPRGGVDGVPAAAARRVAAANGGQMVRCRCAPGVRRVEVKVAVPVRAIAVSRFAGRTAAATAQARLVPGRPLSRAAGDLVRARRSPAPRSLQPPGGHVRGAE